MARARNAALSVAGIVRENMLAVIDQGLGARNWSILGKMARRRAGLDEAAA